MSKNLKILLTVVLSLMVAAPVMAANFTFHGDLNNRFLLYTDQAGFFATNPVNAELDDNDRADSFGEIKYRLWTEASTDDGKVKGVFAIEVGAVRFGRTGVGRSQGGSFSGDGANIETRWFYTDFQIPSVDSKARFQIGLLPHKVNRFFWSETAMGVKFYGDNYYIAWIRGVDQFPTTTGQDWGDNDMDSINARYDLKMEPVKVGFFASYLWEKTDATSNTFDPVVHSQVKGFPQPGIQFDLLAIGVDGSWSTGTNFGKVFVNWDLIYETGSIDDVGVAGNNLDISAYLLHGDFGLNFGKATVTYTVWYASGDDDPNDKDLNNYFTVDVDHFDSFIFQEGYTDDNVFFEGPHISDRGLFFNKLALDYAVDKKLKVGVAGIYHLLAEDVVLATGAKEKDLGFEIDLYGKYKIYGNLELALNFAYLASGDAMDVFETGTSSNVGNGKGDVDIILSEARVRYGF